MRDLTRIGIDHVEPQNLIITAYVKDLEQTGKLRWNIAHSLLILFGLSVFATYTLIFLWGFKKIELPHGFIHWLVAATIGQTASLLFIITKDLFSGPRANR